MIKKTIVTNVYIEGDVCRHIDLVDDVAPVMSIDNDISIPEDARYVERHHPVVYMVAEEWNQYWDKEEKVLLFQEFVREISRAKMKCPNNA